MNNPIQTKCSLGSQSTTKTDNSEGVEPIDEAIMLTSIDFPAMSSGPESAFFVDYFPQMCADKCADFRRKLLLNGGVV